MASTFSEEETMLEDWSRHVARARAQPEYIIIITSEVRLFRLVKEGVSTVVVKYEEINKKKKHIRKIRNFRKSSSKSQKSKQSRNSRR